MADLKTAASTVIAGNDLTFQIDVTNNGPSDAQNVVLNDTLDGQLTNAMYCEGSGCTPSAAWTGSDILGTVPAGTTVHVTIKATVNPNTTQGYEIDNTATVTSVTPDPNGGNNDSSTTTTVQTQADLSVGKTAPVTATAGDPAGFNYTLGVHNCGPSDNTGGFHVTDTLDPRLTFQSTGSSPACSAVGQVVTCTNNTGLPAGGNQFFTVHVTLDSTVDSGTVIANTASVASDGTLDPNAANNTSSRTSTTVTEDVHLSVTKTFDTTRSTAGGVRETFTIAVHNSGFSDADNVVLTDSVDPRLIVDSTSGGFDVRTRRASRSTARVAHLAAGATATLVVTYHVDTTTDSDPSVSNTANAHSDENTAAPSSDTVAIDEDVQLSVDEVRSTRRPRPRAARVARSRST